MSHLLTHLRGALLRLTRQACQEPCQKPSNRWWADLGGIEIPVRLSARVEPCQQSVSNPVKNPPTDDGTDLGGIEIPVHLRARVEPCQQSVSSPVKNPPTPCTSGLSRVVKHGDSVNSKHGFRTPTTGVGHPNNTLLTGLRSTIEPWNNSIDF
jgi:hypothetical protein